MMVAYFKIIPYIYFLNKHVRFMQDKFYIFSIVKYELKIIERHFMDTVGYCSPQYGSKRFLPEIERNCGITFSILLPSLFNFSTHSRHIF